MNAKPIYAITPFSLLDYNDYTSCILWFAGCNMKCVYCYNPEIVNGKGNHSFQYVLDFLDRRKGLLDGVVFSGGECTLHNNLHLFIKEIKKRGYKVKVDTNGLKPEVINSLIKDSLIDYIALDFKSLPEDFKKITDSNLFENFEKTVDILLSLDFPFEIRTTVHSKLISVDQLKKMVNYLENRGYTNNYFFQPFRNEVETIGDLPYSYISDDYKEVKSSIFPISWR